MEYEKFLTERQNPASIGLDRMSNEDIVRLFLQEEQVVDVALKSAARELSAGIDMVAHALAQGRIFMVGAGTSGRLAVLEAAECPPTFGTPSNKIIAIMAGGAEAVFRSREGAEDDPDSGARALAEHIAGEHDLMVGIAASGLTPFVQGALKFARTQGVRTILITCNPDYVPHDCADLMIPLPVGPEILTGSTRLKAGTATKRALNILTTGAMVRSGKVYRNFMVDVQANSNKLRARAIRMVALISGVEATTAASFLEQAGGSARVAIVMARLNVTRQEAEQRLARASGFLREIIEFPAPE